MHEPAFPFGTHSNSTGHESAAPTMQSCEQKPPSVVVTHKLLSQYWL